MIANKLNPGSEKAIEKGCICPVLDNYHGKGFEGKFWMVENCPLHGNIRNKDKSEEEKLWKSWKEKRKMKRVIYKENCKSFLYETYTEGLEWDYCGQGDLISVVECKKRLFESGKMPPPYDEGHTSCPEDCIKFEKR